MKTPKFFTKISAIVQARTKKKLRAATRAAANESLDGYEEETTTNISSAFVIVLILHVVAVGGIYAFNSIKSSRRAHEQPPAPISASAKSPAAGTAKISSLPDPTTAPTKRPDSPANLPNSTTKPPALGAKQYTVKTGDNPTKIAQANGIKTEDLLTANNLKEGAVLRAGQVLTLASVKTAPKPIVADTQKDDTQTKKALGTTTKNPPKTYVIKAGDTATSIAKAHGLTVEALTKLNKGLDPKKLLPGKTLTLQKKID